MHRSYVPKSWIDAFIIDEEHPLPKDVEERFFAVVRVKADEEVAVFDGDGREIIGAVKKIAPREGAHFVGARLCTKPRNLPEIVVIAAAIDDAKLAQTIQRGCEYGVDRFIIFAADKSEKFCFGKLEKRQDRLMRIAEDAARQSGRYFLPKLEFVNSLDDVVRCAEKNCGLKIFGDVAENKLLSHHLKNQNLNEQPCYIAVGPEGGLSAREISQLRAAGFVGVIWAPHVLRAELASLAAVTLINAHLGRA